MDMVTILKGVPKNSPNKAFYEHEFDGYENLSIFMEDGKEIGAADFTVNEIIFIHIA